MRKDFSLFRSVSACLLLSGCYLVALLVAKLGRKTRPSRNFFPRRVAVTGTFYHERWFQSHVLPLADCGVDEVIVVADEALSPLERVQYCCPPKWLRCLIGRSPAKGLWMIVAGIRYRPDVYMGYHVFPGAMMALVAARLFGRPACYQMTGGPVEVEGGGWQAENPLMNALGRPAPSVQELALSLLRQFDLILVRGSRAKRFLADHHIAGNVAVVTGSVIDSRLANGASRIYDLVFVGRLTAIKQPFLFVDVVAAVKQSRPDVRAILVGDGPDLPMLKQFAKDSGVGDNIEFAGQREDVADILHRSRVFVLTSRSEGMSIAMAEAMYCGVPPVVADVGELADLVESGRNGWLVPPGDVHRYADRALGLLNDEAAWSRFSSAARQAAKSITSVEQVAQRWRAVLKGEWSGRTSLGNASG